MPNSRIYEDTPATFIFVPPRVQTILIVSLRSDSRLDIITSQPFGRLVHTIVPHFGGTLICICNINRFFYNIFLQSQNRRYRIVKVKSSHVMLIHEQVWNPFLKVKRIPTLWDSAAINLFLQGYTEKDCSVLLASPLPFWTKAIFVIKARGASITPSLPFLSCANPEHSTTWISERVIMQELWEGAT